MKQKIGSTFLKEFEDYEPPFFWKLTLRQTVFMVGCVLLGGLSLVITYYKLPELFIYIIGGILFPPFLLYGAKRERQFMDRFLFFLTVKERPYRTENEREYSRDEFIQSKKVKETDSF
ncbi:PrgI family protein [Streptococcus cameli]